MSREMVDGFRLSPQQQRLWLLQDHEKSQPYWVQCAVEVEGDLDAPRFREAIEAVVATHEILRVTFLLAAEGDLPLQRVAASRPSRWNEHDWSDCDRAEQKARGAALLRARRRAPLDLAAGPLFWPTLARLSDTRHLLLLTLPALCADAATLDNLLHAISRAYAARLRGEAFAETPIQYGDVATLWNDLLESTESAAGRRVWQHQAVSDLKLPYEKETLESATFDPRIISVRLNDALAQQLATLAEASGTPVDAWLLACWQLCLASLCGESTLTVGVAYDGRAYEGLRDTLGLFARTVPLRGIIEGHLPFTKFVTQVSQALRDASAWQDYFTPAFLPYQFDFRRHRPVAPQAKLSLSIAETYICTDRFKTKLSCVQSEERILAQIYYDATVFEASKMEQLVAAYLTLLTRATHSPETVLERFELLGDGERHQLLVAANQTQFDFPRTKTIHQLFEEQVQRSPHRRAVVFQEERLSFAELNAQANQLAHHLTTLGVGPEVPVGLYVTRSASMIVALLAILKAGGAYVPLDPAAPKARLAFLLENAQIAAVITQARLKASLPEHRAKVVCLDNDWDVIARSPVTNPGPTVAAENLAYIIYTSGSTGIPKGVMVQHRSVVNLVTALHEAIYKTWGPALRVSLNAPLVFDGSVKQWVQLLNGHTLYIVPEDVRSDTAKLLTFVEQQAIAVLDCTPSQLRLLLAAGFGQTVAPVGVLVGGEALDKPTWQQLARSERTDFVNVYGPTEATVDATVCRVRQVPGQPTMGSPIANVQVYVLDRYGRPVPRGVAGELYLGGAGLARGYLGQPARTAERFVPHPFSQEPGARLYRTGDLARWLEDGQNLEFLGRADFQVQLHGIRVELGEIEALLVSHPAVRDAIVMVRETALGDEQLVAYLVPTQPASDGRTQEVGLADALRPFLRQRLPEYMVPRFWVPLASMPLTRNGKIDRAALPDPQGYALASSAAYVAPRNATEQAITAIWQDVLGVQKVGIHDNFFDLGGHSLLLVQAFDRLRDLFGKEFSLVEMYRHPTVSALTDYFDAERAAPTASDKVQARVQKQRDALQRQRPSPNKRNRPA